MEWAENEKGKQYSTNTQGEAVSSTMFNSCNREFEIPILFSSLTVPNDEIGVEPFVNLQWLDQ